MGARPVLASFVTSPQTGLEGGMLSRLRVLLRGVTQQRERSLRCVETLQLGPRRTLYLVECDGQRFLAGAGNDGIHTLLPLAKAASEAGETAS